jgi:hypothetical protein
MLRQQLEISSKGNKAMAKTMEEIQTRWVNLQQQLSDVYSNQPTNEELVLVVEEMFAASGGLTDVVKGMVKDLADRGCLTAEAVRRLNEVAPPCADEARRLLRIPVSRR